MWPYLAAAGLLVCLLALVKLNTAPDCLENYRADIIIQVPEARISAEVADKPSELEKGLSTKSCIGKNQGMLFIFERPGYHNFWMKEMNFPIDIVWLDERKRVIEVTENVDPATYPDTFASSQPSGYVLELQAGAAAKHGIRPGTELIFKH